MSRKPTLNILASVLLQNMVEPKMPSNVKSSRRDFKIRKCGSTF